MAGAVFSRHALVRLVLFGLLGLGLFGLGMVVLARRVGCSESQITKIETGRVAPERRPLLRTIAGRLIVGQAKNQMVAGRFREARAALAMARRLGLEPPGQVLRLAARLPAWPTAQACRLAIRLRQRWHHRAFGSDRAPSTQSIE